jgi:DNA (cytosine-5)-methyltransferase 1
MNHKFLYTWYLKNGYPSKDVQKNNLKVFSCFSCGGGSTMGYKLAGYDVIGINEIDKRMVDIYVKNHNPKYVYNEGIQTFKNRNDLPEELYTIDILDSSPPCSLFSLAGNREKDWGKKKKFREGQVDQVLDTLFFDSIDVVKKLQPKVAIHENVKGLLFGKANEYVTRIYQEFKNIGYHIKYYLLNSKDMGVPQRRERVFFIAIRNDICNKLEKSIFEDFPNLNMEFYEKEILYKEIEEKDACASYIFPCLENLYDKVKEGDNFSTIKKGSFFNCNKAHRNKVLPTVTAHTNGGGTYHYLVHRPLTNKELCLASTFPLDYDFLNEKVKYVVGMSVPPIMMAQIALRIKENIFDKISVDNVT